MRKGIIGKSSIDGYYYWCGASPDDDDWMGPFVSYEDAKADAEICGYEIGGDNYAD